MIKLHVGKKKQALSFSGVRIGATAPGDNLATGKGEENHIPF